MQDTKKIIIAIDGVAGAGKSVTAKLLAKELGYTYINTGSMYRAIALKVKQHGAEVMGETELNKLLANTVVNLVGEQVFLDGNEVSGDIRTEEVSSMASVVSQNPLVRAYLTRQQQAMGSHKGIVMDGRDIGTVVFPQAELKIFMTANPEVRAQRRAKELNLDQENLSNIMQQIDARDEKDTKRQHAPLTKAQDAITIDTSNMSIEDQVAEIKHYALQRIDKIR